GAQDAGAVHAVEVSCGTACDAGLAENVGVKGDNVKETGRAVVRERRSAGARSSHNDAVSARAGGDGEGGGGLIVIGQGIEVIALVVGDVDAGRTEQVETVGL